MGSSSKGSANRCKHVVPSHASLQRQSLQISTCHCPVHEASTTIHYIHTSGTPSVAVTVFYLFLPWKMTRVKPCEYLV